MPPAIIEIQDPLRSATRPYRYPERDVEGAVPYEGGANPEKKRVSAVHRGRLRAAGSRPYFRTIPPGSHPNVGEASRPMANELPWRA